MVPAGNVFLESRYRKLARGLPQTIFYCPECRGHRRRRLRCARCEGFGKLTKDSVQEILARRILRAFGTRRGKFHGAGREDVDVLMLGRGRPFVFEVVAPGETDVDLAALREQIHCEEGERVQVDPFRVVERARVGQLKEAQFDKVYRLGVSVEGGVDPARLEPLVGRRTTLRQRTPERVAHRRADLVRERDVTVLGLRPTPEDSESDLEVELRTQHGTYVKEWVSGDGGRTEPSLTAYLGAPTRCVRLDVLEVLDDRDPERPRS